MKNLFTAFLLLIPFTLTAQLYVSGSANMTTLIGEKSNIQSDYSPGFGGDIGIDYQIKDQSFGIGVLYSYQQIDFDDENKVSQFVMLSGMFRGGSFLKYGLGYYGAYRFNFTEKETAINPATNTSIFHGPQLELALSFGRYQVFANQKWSYMDYLEYDGFNMVNTMLGLRFAVLN